MGTPKEVIFTGWEWGHLGLDGVLHDGVDEAGEEGGQHGLDGGLVLLQGLQEQHEELVSQLALLSAGHRYLV